MLETSHLFPSLRGLLCAPEDQPARRPGSVRWQKALHQILRQAQQEDRVAYEDVWLPYCEQHRELFVGFWIDCFSCEDIADAHALAPFAELRLHLYTTHMERAERIAMSSSLRWVNCILLDLDERTDTSLIHILRSPCLRSLYALDLDSNWINDKDVQEIAGMEGLKSLRYWKLYDNQIGDEGARALAQSRLFSELVHLDISGNKIGVEGMRALGECAWFPKLEHLEIDIELHSGGRERWLELLWHPHLARALRSNRSLGRRSEPLLGRLLNLTERELIVERAEQYAVRVCPTESKEDILRAIWEERSISDDKCH